MSRRFKFLALASVFILCWVVPVSAQYVLVLKNGRRITVQSYREDGRMIKFYGMGGEIGIAKDQIQTILKAGEGEQQGLSVPPLAAPSPPTPGPAKASSETPTVESKKPAAPDPIVAEERAREEKEYQKRLKEVTEKLDAAKQRYFAATQGGGTTSNVSKEGFKAWAADLSSRIKDSQKIPLSDYSPRERELSELRDQIDQLQKERDTLIEEIKSKNFDTGSP
jgi:hypothetical protein